MHRITHVAVRNDYRLDLTFADGVCGTVDLSDLAGRGVFALWNDYAEFQKVQIGERGELTWGNQLDLCPDSLYLRATGKNPGDIFPLLKCEPTRA